MERSGQASGGENRSSREERRTSTTHVTGPILIESIYIDLGVLIHNKHNQHCSNRGDVSDVGDDVATNGSGVATTDDDAIEVEEGPICRRTRSKCAMRNDATTAMANNEAKPSQPRRQKARKKRSLTDIYAATECDSQFNNGEGGDRLNESLAPTLEIRGQRQSLATDEADEEAVQVLLSLRDA